MTQFFRTRTSRPSLEWLEVATEEFDMAIWGRLHLRKSLRAIVGPGLEVAAAALAAAGACRRRPLSGAAHVACISPSVSKAARM